MGAYVGDADEFWLSISMRSRVPTSWKMNEVPLMLESVRAQRPVMRIPDLFVMVMPVASVRSRGSKVWFETAS